MRKCIIFTVNKKYLFIGSILILLIALLLFTNLSVQSLSPNTKYTVVIDAGHGGIDGGSVGKVSGISEATLNLDYAKCLQNYMQDFGLKCYIALCCKFIYNKMQRRCAYEKRKLYL